MFEKLKAIIQLIQENESLPVTQDITPEMSLRDDLSFDSLNLAELTVRIEDEFSVDIFQDQLVETVGEIIKIIEKGA
jgi:acyl carrier protein